MTKSFTRMLLSASLAVSAMAQGTRVELQAIPKVSEAGAAEFGRSIAVTRDMIAFGVPGAYSTGSSNLPVEVYDRTPLGWVRNSSVPRPPGLTSADGLGFSMDIDGSTIVSGAWLYGSGRGAVYVYRDIGGGQWTDVSRIDSPYSSRAQFGFSVDLEGDLLAVGAPVVDGSQFTWEGRVHILRWNGSTWDTLQVLESPAGEVTANYAYFGRQVALANGRLVVSANRPQHRGVVYIYARDVQGTWVLEETLKEPDTEYGAQFGLDIAFDGEVLVVGKTRNAFSGLSGRAVVFERSPLGTWIRTADIRASDGHGAHGGDQFGHSVALEDGVIAVGSMLAHGNGIFDGAVYMFRRDALGQWPSTESERFITSDGLEGSLGSTVALGGGFVVANTLLRRLSQQAIYVFPGGVETDICAPAAGPGAIESRLDTFRGTNDVAGFVLSRCPTGTRYLVAASPFGIVGGGGTVIGGMPLCLGGAIQRAGFGIVTAGAVLDFVEPHELYPSAALLLGTPGLVYVQAYVSEPGGVLGFSNAAALRVW